MVDQDTVYSVPLLRLRSYLFVITRLTGRGTTERINMTLSMQ